MITGKPALTFGDGQLPAVTQKRSRQTRSIGMQAPQKGSFESYLSDPSLVQALAGQVSGQATGKGGSARGKSAPAMPVGMPPDATSRNTAMTQQTMQRVERSARFNRTAGLPVDGQSHGQARANAQLSMENYTVEQLSGGQVRVSAKTRPHVSGSPVTGRTAIGMVDTRKNPQTQQSIAGQRISEADQPFIARRESYINYGLGRGNGFTPQSFITQGFGGDTAEAAIRTLGYDRKENQSMATRAKAYTPASGVRSAMEMSAQLARQKNGLLGMNGKQEPDAAGEFGRLAAKFESGSEGICAVGYDRTGGTSYGKYQISSRAGTMGTFIAYLKEKAPELAQRLVAAGPANTYSRSGAMPTEWRKIAEENPHTFEELQSDFIRSSHFEPVKETIAQKTGVSFDALPAVFQEVLFSTAVQHGVSGATRIVSQAINRVGADKLQFADNASLDDFKKAGKQLIQQIYSLRSGQFSSSTARVQAAAKNRMHQEMREALAMLF